MFEAREEHLWPETGWARVVFIPRGQTHVHRINKIAIDDCVFFHGDIIFMVYVDNGIFLGSNNLQLQEVIKEIQNLGLNIKDQGHPADYAGVNILKLKDGSYEFTQRLFIDKPIGPVALPHTDRQTVSFLVYFTLS